MSEDSVLNASKLFRGFSDPSRLSIVFAIQSEAMNVSEIVSGTGLSQPNVSNHLRCLSECGIVVSKRTGRQVQYSLSDPRVALLLRLVDELLTDVATGVVTCPNFKNQEFYE